MDGRCLWKHCVHSIYLKVLLRRANLNRNDSRDEPLYLNDILRGQK